MISFETWFVEIDQVVLEILNFSVFSDTRVMKLVFWRLWKKFLGHIKKNFRSLFHSSRPFIEAMKHPMLLVDITTTTTTTTRLSPSVTP